MIPNYSHALRSAKESPAGKARSGAQAFILVTGADGLTLWVNEAFESVMGYTLE